jgi:hypothetical protein
VKSFSPLFLTAILVAVFVPANAFADDVYITVTETTPTTVTINTNLTGALTSQSLTMSLVPGYYNNRAPGLQFIGPDAKTNDTGGALGEYPGTLAIGDSLIDGPAVDYHGEDAAAINWLDPKSTPSTPLYDTLDVSGPGPVPDTSFLFSSDNEVPTVGLQGAGICYGDNGFPVDCPIVPYGTVVNAFYNLRWGSNDTYGPITVTFIDQADVAVTPEPATWIMMLFGIGGAALLRRRLLGSGNPL